MPTIFNVGVGDVGTLVKDVLTADTNGQSSNVINLSKSTYDLTAISNYWYGPEGLPPIFSNLTIHGNGAVIQRDPGAKTPDFRLFYVSGGLSAPAGSLTMDNVTLEGGIAQGGNSSYGGGGMGAGGAIFNQGTLSLTDVTLTNNEALGGSSGVGTDALGGGGMGSDADNSDHGGGFGGGFVVVVGGSGGSGSGGGGGFVSGANGGNGTPAGNGGNGGGLGGFGGKGGGLAIATPGSGGDGGGGQADGSFSDGGGGGFGGGGGGGGGGGVGGGGGLDGGGGFGGGGGGEDRAFGGNGDFAGNGGFGGGGGSVGPNAGGGNGGKGGFGGGKGSGSGLGGGGAGLGGAIFNMGADSADPGSGQVALRNCTLTANTAQGGNGGGGTGAGDGGDGLGGAFFNLDGTVTLINDTLALNSVAGGSGAGTSSAHGGAVYNLVFGRDIDTGNAVTASLILNNSILSNSFVANIININGGLVAVDDLDSETSATVSGSTSLVMSSTGSIPFGVITLTADPQLGSLQDNGGLTPTLLPSTGSPVLGAGDPGLASFTDQRGQPRPPAGPTDLGSVQVSVATTTGSGSSSSGGSSSGTSASAGLIGLAIEEFELVVDEILTDIEGLLNMPHADLDATIAQLQAAIANDPLTPTSTGQLALSLGESLALSALGGS